ncbi:hypothetical protein [Paenibacillus sp. ACRRY]|uniref:hypothetical protein n=1 Tax=Paenibacillus sp. ACRRY TaxID=2918208 RepID=UPI001EF5C6C4|nr:hypothetical protein [Paenibacillus sp. ACRRY]MCG7386865.1 hypothetical protein [Paenibacillus sp. ACRRY]
MFLKRRIYFEKDTGIVVQMTGGFFDSGYEIQPTIDRDFEVYVRLAERVRNTLDVVELPNDYEQDFENGGLVIKVDIETRKPLFTYPDPQEPETPTSPQPALSTKVATLESETTATQAALASTFEALIQSQEETTTAQLALADVYEQLVNMRAELDALKGGDV